MRSQRHNDDYVAMRVSFNSLFEMHTRGLACPMLGGRGTFQFSI